MIKAVCRKTCIWKGRYWRAGEVYQGAAVPPRHFTVTDEAAEKTAPKRTKENKEAEA